MSKHEVAEITWENGQLPMQGLLHTTPTKPTWGRSNDTLESIVHQATCHSNKDAAPNSLQHNQKSPEKMTPGFATSSGKCSESSGRLLMVPRMPKKRTSPESNRCGRSFGCSRPEEIADKRSGHASASATFRRDNDTTLMTWASNESSRSFKPKIATDEDSASHGGSENQDENHETKMETGRSRSLRRSRAAAIHNQSERRRRDRINQKLRALQRLVPNASKTDKASMLDEVIDYLKQLQRQVQMMRARNMPQMNMMMPLSMQQHLQMALLARMGMGVGLGVGMGIFDINTMTAAACSAPQSIPHLIHPKAPVSATTSASFVLSPFMVPPMIATCTPASQANSESGDTNASVPFRDPYCAFLAQSMNMELYNKMEALFGQQVNQSTRQQVNQNTQQQATSSPSTQSDQMQGE